MKYKYLLYIKYGLILLYLCHGNIYHIYLRLIENCKQNAFQNFARYEQNISAYLCLLLERKWLTSIFVISIINY